MESNKERIVIGIDGGGTHTRLVLATESGVILGTGESGSANFDDIGIERARESIHQCFEKAWRNSKMPPRKVDAAFWGMAGVVSEADRQIVRDMAKDLDFAPIESTGVDHDIRIALAGNLALKPGIVLIVGTGSSCYGQSADGKSCRVGGWGHLLDDDGSGYYLGLEALKAVVRSIDGRLGHTALVDKIKTALQISDEQEIMLRLYHPPMSRLQVAALAPLVLETAKEDDPIAQNIIKNGLSGLSHLVEVATLQLDFPKDETYVTTTGGLAQSGQYFKNLLYEAILSRIPHAKIQEPVLSPVLGATLLAISSLGEPPLQEVISKLKNYG